LNLYRRKNKRKTTCDFFYCPRLIGYLQFIFFMLLPPRILVIWVAIILGMFWSLHRNLMKRIGLQTVTTRNQKRFKQTTTEANEILEEVEKEEETTKLKSDLTVIFFLIMKDRFGIFGLGNPGSDYVNTRHNIGFNCVEDYAKRINVFFALNKAKCLYGELKTDSKLVIIGQPQTFMNLRYVSEKWNFSLT
jgi:hypothetical protein